MISAVLTCDLASNTMFKLLSFFLHLLSVELSLLVTLWLICGGTRYAAATLSGSGNSLRQTVHTHHASVHQAAKLAPAYGPGR